MLQLRLAIRPAEMDTVDIGVLGMRGRIAAVNCLGDRLPGRWIEQGDAAPPETSPAESCAVDPGRLAQNLVQGNQGGATRLVVLDGTGTRFRHQ